MKRDKKPHALKRVVEKNVPKALRERLADARELVYDGWELLDSDVREAKKCFSQAITLDPDLADAQNGLAEVALAKGDVVDGRGSLYLNVGRYEQAIALFEDLLARNPNDNQGIR